MKRGIPYRSQFEQYYTLIRDERRARKTWDEIASRLNQEHGLQTLGRVIQAWFKRRQKRKGLPLGFEDVSLPSSEAIQGAMQKSTQERISKLLNASTPLPSPNSKWNFGAIENSPLTKKDIP